MDSNFEKTTSEHASEEWIERLKHEEIMRKLSGIRGYETQSNCDYGYCMNWKVDAPSVNELQEIVERGNKEEILYLIHQYGKALPPKTPPRGCTACNGGRWEITVIPEEIQELIAKRGVPVEMAAFVSYYGFGEKGQNVILGRANHEEIMWYVDQHGLLLEQQRKLFKRGNKDEINLHLLRHGMHDVLINEMFSSIQQENSKELFYQCIKGPEFSVANQIKMLNIVNHKEFSAYITEHGLWEDVHEELVNKRSEEEVRLYIIRHRYLSPKAARKFIEKTDTSGRLFFMKNAISGIYFAMDALLSTKPCDLEALEYGFKNYQYYANDEDFDEQDLMLNGTENQVLEYIRNNRYLRMKSWATLFFRGELSLFKKCLKYAKYK